MGKQTTLSTFEELFYDFERRDLKEQVQKYYPRTKLRETTANELTKSIKAWLQYSGFDVERVNTQGNYSNKLKRYVYSGSTKGAADLSATIYGMTVKIEVKAGRDKPRPAQLERQKSIQKSGGFYIFVYNFDDFIVKITDVIDEIKDRFCYKKE